MQTLITISTAIVGAAAGAVGAWVTLRRDGREARSQAVDEAKTTVALLEKQNDLLTKQLEASHAAQVESTKAWREREAEWRKSEEKLEKRIAGVEASYRDMVKTVTTMGLCASAPNCPNYNPGDRRTPAAI